jgi:hypothetical protein
MAWSSVKVNAQGQLYLYLAVSRITTEAAIAVT